MTARILVVDDEQDIRDVIVTRLRGAGYEVIEAESGESAVELAQKNPQDDPVHVDLVLLDVMMPGMNGYDVLEHFQAQPDKPTIIFLSALSASNCKVSALHRGARDFLTKSCDPDEFLARVDAALRERKLLQQAQSDSLTDALTGIGNRRAFETTLSEEIARSKRYAHPLALISIDADGLKKVNDTMGHEGGDELLKAIARAMQAAVRETDRAFRIGGDEFAMLLPETNRKEAACFFDRLKDALSHGVTPPICNTANPMPAMLQIGRVTPSASLGLAVMPFDACDAAGLMKAADRDLYRSKAARTPESATGNVPVRGRWPLTQPRRDAA